MGRSGRELRGAIKRLARTPVFTAVSVLTVGVGIGAFAAIYSVVDGILLEPPPYAEPEELVWVWRDYPWLNLPRGWLGGPDIVGLREHGEAFEGVIGFRTGGRNLTGRDGERPRRVRVTLASAGFLGLLGVRPALGRGFFPEEDDPQAPAVAVLGHDLWVSHFGADPGVVGSEIYLNGEATTVVGVAPRDFRFVVHSSLGSPRGADLYQPLRIDLAAEDPGSGAFAGLARVSEGAAPEQVEAALAAVAEDLDRLWGNPGLGMWRVGLMEDLVSGVRPALTALLAASAFLILILGANLATLLLTRATARDRELAVRAALGAERGRLFQTVLAESLTIGGAGAVIGLAVAYPGLDLLRRLAPEDLPRAASVGVDPSVVAMALVAAALMSVMAGFLPSIRALRGDLSSRLRDGGGRGGVGLAGLRTRSILVVGQVALSLVLLVGAGLVTRGYMGLLDADPGFDGRSALTFSVALDPRRYDEEGAVAAFDRRFREALTGLPGVEVVGAADALPLTAAANQITVTFPGAPGNTGVEERDRPLVDYTYLGPGYAEAVGLRLLQGRTFDDRDAAGAPRVALVDDVLAARFFPDDGAVGGRLTYRGDTLTIVGVIDQPRLYAVQADDRPQLFIPLLQEPVRTTLAYVVAAGDDAESMVPAVRKVLDEVDGSVPLTEVRTLGELVEGSLAQERLSLTLLLGFAIGALLLATLGLYGVVSNGVARRTHEMGVRIALGAGRPAVLGLVIGQGMRLTTLGVILGLLGSLAASRGVERVIVGADAGDPLVYGSVVAGLITLSALAAWLPARRATRIDPARALRPD